MTGRRCTSPMSTTANVTRGAFDVAEERSLEEEFGGVTAVRYRTGVWGEVLSEVTRHK